MWRNVEGHNLGMGSNFELSDLLKPHLSPALPHWKWTRVSTLLHYLHLTQVTNPFFIYSHLSFLHVELCRMAGHMSHIYEPSIWPCSPRVSHSSVVRASNRYLEGHGCNSRWGLRKFFFWVIRLENASSFFPLTAFYSLRRKTSLYNLFK